MESSASAGASRPPFWIRAAGGRSRWSCLSTRSSRHQAPAGATYGQSCRWPARPCYQSASLACAVLAGTGLALAFLLPADRGSQRTSCRNRTRRPMPLPQETW